MSGSCKDVQLGSTFAKNFAKKSVPVLPSDVIRIVGFSISCILPREISIYSIDLLEANSFQKEG
jgi:hypothetical protein